MANKYLISGATYYGDGTTSAEATSNGGVGAWSNINVMTGTTPTYGTLANNDTIYVRSKTSAGANISVALNAGTVGPASGVTGTTWIIDNGATWSGINGTVTFLTNTTNNSISTRALTTYIALTDRALRIINDRANYTGSPIFVRGTHINCEFGFPNKTDTAVGAPVDVSGAICYDCTFVLNVFPAYIYCSSGLNTKLFNPKILLTSSVGLSNANGVINYSSPGLLEIYGGSISGAGAIAAQSVFYGGTTAGTSAGRVVTDGFYFPAEMPMLSMSVEGTAMGSVDMLSADKKASASLARAWGYADSRNDSYYPVLLGALPDSADTKWSWKLKSGFASAYMPAWLLMSRMYTEAAAAKTVTLEMLASNSISGLDKSNVYLVVQYVDDATGNIVRETTKTTGSLTTSTAGWTTTTYGAASCDKVSLSLTTANSIKQDTLVSMYLFITVAANLANDFYFVDPEPTLS